MTAIKILLCIIALMVTAQTGHADVATTYKRACATCHDSGALNAPKKSDRATWSALQSQKGMSTLVQSVRHGMPQMPAMGLCQSCSDDDFRQLIEYMSK